MTGVNAKCVKMALRGSVGACSMPESVAVQYDDDVQSAVMYDDVR